MLFICNLRNLRKRILSSWTLVEQRALLLIPPKLTGIFSLAAIRLIYAIVLMLSGLPEKTMRLLTGIRKSEVIMQVKQKRRKEFCLNIWHSCFLVNDQIKSN